MRVRQDFRRGRGGEGHIVIEMSLDEFREHVEWLEALSPTDGCTADFRAELDRVDPQGEEADGG
jgi:hypothetical protein